MPARGPLLGAEQPSRYVTLLAEDMRRAQEALATLTSVFATRTRARPK